MTPEARTSSSRSSTIGSQATPTSRRQRSRVPTASATPNQVIRNSRMRRRDWGWRTARAVMKAASDGPIRLRSLTSKCRLRSPWNESTAGAGTGRGLVAARAAHHLVAVLHAADPDAAVGALQLQDRERLGRADDRVPHLERRAATGADRRPVALGAFGLQRRVPPLAFGSGLLAGLAARRWWRLRARRRGPSAGTAVPAPDAAARRVAFSAKRRIGRWRPRAVGRIQRQALAQLHCQGVKTASQLDKLRRFQRLEYGAVQSAQVKLVFGSHVFSESQMLPRGKPLRHANSLKRMGESIGRTRRSGR